MESNWKLHLPTPSICNPDNITVYGDPIVLQFWESSKWYISLIYYRNIGSYVVRCYTVAMVELMFDRDRNTISPWATSKHQRVHGSLKSAEAYVRTLDPLMLELQYG